MLYNGASEQMENVSLEPLPTSSPDAIDQWMCSHVTGRQVLVVGGAESLTTVLLLARQGCVVTSVDCDPTAHLSAQQHLESQPTLVQKNVTLQTMRDGRLPFTEQAFDTMFIGNGIEQHMRLAVVLEGTRQLLKPGGTLVMTVPFGFTSTHTNIRSYGLSAFCEAVGGLFETRDLAIQERTICFAGTPASNGLHSGLKAEEAMHLLRVSEEAFRTVEQLYAREDDGYRRRIAVLEGRLEETRRHLLAYRKLHTYVVDILQETSEYISAHQTRFSIDVARASIQEAIARASRQDSLREALGAIPIIVRQVLHQANTRRHDQLAQSELEKNVLVEETGRLVRALQQKEGEIRYRLGDALVRACDGPKEFLFLPLRLLQLFRAGLRNRLARRRS